MSPPWRTVLLAGLAALFLFFAWERLAIGVDFQSDITTIHKKFLKKMYREDVMLGVGLARIDNEYFLAWEKSVLMVKVSAGYFIRGSTSEEVEDAYQEFKKTYNKAKREWFEGEMPQRRIYLDAFYIDKYPVTNARFRRFGKSRAICGWSGQALGPVTPPEGTDFHDLEMLLRCNMADRQPVVNVTWMQAHNYCRFMGKRLPTEAEWEKAARGVDGRKYSWGNQWDSSKVVYFGNSALFIYGNIPLSMEGTQVVNRTYHTHRSPYGVVDMSGNQREWVKDWFKKDYYRNAPNRNPNGPSSGRERVVRGGAWNVKDPTWFRTTNRGRFHPDDWKDGLGFRCAKSS